MGCVEREIGKKIVRDFSLLRINNFMNPIAGPKDLSDRSFRV
jgi:hypothetical protein